MVENLEGAGVGSGAVRLPYVKPFVHNLDVDDTEGKNVPNTGEATFPTFHITVGPS